jgi:hypothetical protein
MAGRPPKPLHLVTGHITKAEKQLREKSENELLTGTHLKEFPEVKDNPIAHKEFIRLKKLLKSINKDDDLYGNIINTHCLLQAECKNIERFQANLKLDLEQLENKFEKNEISFEETMHLKTTIHKQILNYDKSLMGKRKLILDISKENIMTVQSALRSIPKKQQKVQKSNMSNFLEKRGYGKPT